MFLAKFGLQFFQKLLQCKFNCPENQVPKKDTLIYLYMDNLLIQNQICLMSNCSCNYSLMLSHMKNAKQHSQHARLDTHAIRPSDLNAINTR